jgi:outer membrane protein TolC
MATLPCTIRRGRPLLFGLVLLAGCYGGPTKHEEQARQDFQETAKVYRPQNAKPVLPTLTVDSTLPDLMTYALLNSPTVEAAFYDWKAAVESITIARSLPDPMLSFSTEITRSIGSLVPTLMTDPAASWPGPGKLGLRGEAAYQDAEKKRAIFENEMLAAALAVKRAYYQMWVLEEEIRWTRESLALVDQMEQLALARLAVGKVTQQDVLRAQMERDRLKTQLASYEDSRGPLAARMRSALGLGPQQGLPAFVAHVVPTAPDFTEQSLMEVAYARNPKLKAMRSEVAQAVALFQLARKNTVPDFSLGVGTDVKGSPVPLMLNFGVTLPVWRSRIAAEIAQGSAAVGVARAKLSTEELDLAVTFAETAFAWREADRNARLYGDGLIPKAKASLESARAGYAGGLSSFADLLDAQRALLEYRLANAMAIGQREIVLSEMSLVILGRWPEGVGTVLQPEPSPQAQPAPESRK